MTDPARERQEAYDAFFKSFIQYVIDDDASIGTSTTSLEGKLEDLRAKDLLNNQHEDALDIQYMRNHEHQRIQQKSRMDQLSYNYAAQYAELKQKGYKKDTIREYLSTYTPITEEAETSAAAHNRRSGHETPLWTKYTRLQRKGAHDDAENVSLL